METPPNKNFLLFIAPIIGVILGIAILLSPGFASLFSENKPEEGVSKYAYYKQVITQDELIKLSTEKEIFTVYYNQPIDGISGVFPCRPGIYIYSLTLCWSFLFCQPTFR